MSDEFDPPFFFSNGVFHWGTRAAHGELQRREAMGREAQFMQEKAWSDQQAEASARINGIATEEHSREEEGPTITPEPERSRER